VELARCYVTSTWYTSVPCRAGEQSAGPSCPSPPAPSPVVSEFGYLLSAWIDPLVRGRGSDLTRVTAFFQWAIVKNPVLAISGLAGSVSGKLRVVSQGRRIKGASSAGKVQRAMSTTSRTTRTLGLSIILFRTPTTTPFSSLLFSPTRQHP
jgi:hypothetical protein